MGEWELGHGQRRQRKSTAVAVRALERATPAPVLASKQCRSQRSALLAGDCDAGWAL